MKVVAKRKQPKANEQDTSRASDHHLGFFSSQATASTEIGW
jgi:hypothetical protein